MKTPEIDKGKWPQAAESGTKAALTSDCKIVHRNQKNQLHGDTGRQASGISPEVLIITPDFAAAEDKVLHKEARKNESIRKQLLGIV